MAKVGRLIMPKTRDVPHRLDHRSKRSSAYNKECPPRGFKSFQEKDQERDSRDEQKKLKEALLSWLPTDSNAFMFELVVVTILIIGVINFVLKGDGSILIILLPYVSAYVGLPKVQPLLPWGKGK
jgi:hypothetical protein